MSFENQLDEKNTNELIRIKCTVLEQNYFTYQNQSYFQNTGIAMGAPSSAILSEVYLQHLDHTEFIKILMKNNIIGYFRYVDYILMIHSFIQYSV